MVIAFSDVVFMGSNVLSELVALASETPVRVVARHGCQPRRVLERTGLTATISTFDAVDDVLDAH